MGWVLLLSLLYSRGIWGLECWNNLYFCSRVLNHLAACFFIMSLSLIFCSTFVMPMYKNWYNVDNVFSLSTSDCLKFNGYTVIANCISIVQVISIFLLHFTLFVKFWSYYSCDFLPLNRSLTDSCLLKTNKQIHKQTHTAAMMTLDQ